MPQYDPANEAAGAKLATLGGKPSVKQLVAAIKASPVSASYPDSLLRTATKNDLIYICRLEKVQVPGLPGAADFEGGAMPSVVDGGNAFNPATL